MKTLNRKAAYSIAILAALVLTGCKAPQATVVNDTLSKQLPPEYTENTPPQETSARTPWKTFFTDPVLVSMIESALQANQDLMITWQNIEIAKSEVLLRSGRLYPVISGEGGLGIKKEGRYTSAGAGNAATQIYPGKDMPEPLGNFGAGIHAEWEADIWGKLRDEKKSAVAHYLATVEGKNFILSQLISEIAKNYYELLALDTQLDYINQYRKLQLKALEISKIQKQAAAATELAVKRFETESAKADAMAYTVKQQITEKENMLNALMGRFPQPILRDKKTLTEALPQKFYTGIPSDLLANRPDIRQAELELQAAKLDVEAARKEFYPSL